MWKKPLLLPLFLLTLLAAQQQGAALKPFERSMRGELRQGELKIQYSVVHHERVLHTHGNGVSGAACHSDNKNGVTLYFAADGDAEQWRQQLGEDAVLVGPCVAERQRVEGVSIRAIAASAVQHDKETGRPYISVTGQTAHLSDVFQHANMTAVLRAPPLQSPYSSCSSDCTSCVRYGGGSACQSRCGGCGKDCLTCLQYGDDTKALAACESRCSANCDDTCSKCIFGGGGTGCADRCKPCGSYCTKCIGSGGGTACANDCKNQDTCSATEVADGTCMGSFGGQEIKLPALVDWKKQNQVIYQGNVGPAQFKLSTTDCHLKLQPTVYMELSIEWNRVKSFGISVKGDIDMAAGFALDSSMHMYNMTTFDLTTINLPAISFFIGAFPLVLSPSIPIRAGYRYDVNAAASVNFQEQYHGSISTGVALQGGSLQPSFALNVAPKMPSPPTFQGTATIASTAWLSASLVFNVNGIVRETSDAKVYLDLHGSAKSGQPVHANLIGGFNMSIGGDLGVKLAGVLIPPTSQLGYAQVYHASKVLWSMQQEESHY